MGIGRLSYFTSLFASHPSLKRLLSFGKSIDESSQPSDHQEQQSHLPQDVELTVMTTDNLEMESDSPPIQDETQQAESKRIMKVLNPLALAIAAADMVLYVNLQSVDGGKHGIIYNAHIATTWLSFFTSIGICTYPIIYPIAATSIWVPKRLMLMAIGFTLLSFVLRSFMVLTISSLEYVLLFSSLGAGLALIYLCVAWKEESYSQTTQLWTTTENI